jgi:VIT1/CCC1 family predicted Fe2+/Mn2+ transporter
VSDDVLSLAGAGITGEAHLTIASSGQPVHHHRDVQGGAARAAVFGVSDGLVSNVSLIIAIASAGGSPGAVRLAGLAGLLAGAISMAAGEYVSMRAQTELFERELRIERASIKKNPDLELRELAALYSRKGLSEELSIALAREIHRDIDLAVETHAREELGVDPDSLGSAMQASLSSFGAFAAGALVPLVPWVMLSGGAGITATVGLAAVAAVLVGLAIARFTGRPPLRAAARQLAVAAVAATTTFALGSLVGTGALS